jgi:hypothetical protein
MTTGNVTGLTGCLPCPANFYCNSVTTKEACPQGTFSNPGSVNKHDCKCQDQYDCAYSTVTTKKIALSITPEEFEAKRAEFIAALAASLGVSVSSIKIISIQSSGGTQSLRRVLKLRGGNGQQDSQKSMLRHTTVWITVKPGKLIPKEDSIASRLIRKQGFPALYLTTTQQTLDF